MSQSTPLGQNETYLKQDQYKDSSNLDARAELHRRFTVSGHRWMPWVFDHLMLAEGEQILECGCGPAWLWRENVARIPKGCIITLTDLSDGMVAEAQTALGNNTQFRFQTANIQNLPFDTNAFDVVVANHMLYHVPNLDQALAEVRRVLKPNGRFYAATNGQTHMHELHTLAESIVGTNLSKEFGVRSHTILLSFRLENGRDHLAPYFDQVTLHPYDSHIAVTEAATILNYILSSSEMKNILTNEQREQLLTTIESEIKAKGHFHISKSTGLFAAQ